MVNSNKKGNAMGVFISVVILVLVFIIYLTSVTVKWGDFASSTDDQLCRALVASKDTKAVKLGEFFFELNKKCKKDKFSTVNLENRDEAFKEIGDKMSRCWYRYGEGEYDFLEFAKEDGNWCFLCSQIGMEKNGESISYGDYVEWSKQNNYSDEKTYFNATNLKYVSIDDQEYLNIRTEFTNLVNEKDKDAAVTNLLYVLGEQLDYMDDLNNKQIDSNDDKIFVVYRYDRIPKSFDEKIDSAAKSATVGMVGGIVLSIVAEGAAEAAISGGVSMVGCSATGVGLVASPVCGIIGGITGFATGIFKGIKNTGKTIAKLTKITSIIKKAKKMVKTSKAINMGDEVVEMTQIVLKGEKTIKMAEKIKSFKASPGEIQDLSKIARESGEIDFADNLESLAKMMDDLNLNNLDEIDSRIFNNKEQLTKITKYFDETEKMSTKLHSKIANSEKRLIDNNANLEALRDMAKDDLNNIYTKKDPVALRNYLKLTVVGASGIAGGVIGYDYTKNYEQYVDLLTQEQYYRLCGTHAGNFD